MLRTAKKTQGRQLRSLSGVKLSTNSEKRPLHQGLLMSVRSGCYPMMRKRNHKLKGDVLPNHYIIEHDFWSICNRKKKRDGAFYGLVSDFHWFWMRLIVSRLVVICKLGAAALSVWQWAVSLHLWKSIQWTSAQRRRLPRYWAIICQRQWMEWQGFTSGGTWTLNQGKKRWCHSLG